MHLQTLGNADLRRAIVLRSRSKSADFSLIHLEPIMLRMKLATAKVAVFDNKV